MARCTKTANLEVHHKRRNGEAVLSNAEVLCKPCHADTASFATHGPSADDFPESVKQAALRMAGNRCECERITCH